MRSITISSITDRLTTNKHDSLIIVGPTCSGKTALSIAIAKSINGAVISADSRQVYKGMNIGTGKVTKKEMGRIPHYVLDVCDPSRTYTANRFAKDASRAIAAIRNQKRFPIICGGTGFYIDVLTNKVQLTGVGSDKKLRSQLDQKTTPQLLAQLKRADPNRYATIVSKNEVNNRVRLIRAIEIAKKRSSVKSTWQEEKNHKPISNPLWIGIRLPKEVLRKKISARLEARIRQGMVAEVQRLHASGVSWKRLEALGLEYRHVAHFLQGRATKSEMVKLLDTAIWHYARRQISYWKRNKDIVWVNPHF